MRGFDCHREEYIFEKIFNFGTPSMGFPCYFLLPCIWNSAKLLGLWSFSISSV